MGLVVKTDGWRIPEELWAKMEPLLPPRPAPARLPQPARARPGRANRDPFRPAHGLPVERA